MSALQDLSQEIASDLEKSGFQNDADEVRRLAGLVSNASVSSLEKKNALKGLESMAHVRWLGDLYLPHLSQNEWWGKLDKLKKAIKSTTSKI
jgi:hypothetical protein